MAEHVKQLKGVGYFAAPTGKIVTPFTVLPGEEYIEIICDGKIFFELDGIRRTFGKGTMFWHIAGEETIWDTPEDAPYRCFCFSFLTSTLKRTVPRVTIWNSPDEAVDFSSRMFKIFHEGGFEAEAFRNMIYSKLRWEALSARPLETEDFPEALIKSCRFLDKHFGSGIVPEDAAESAGISRAHLFRLFRKYLDITPHNYLLKQRLNKAKLLLSGETLSIKETAAECGFESIEVFYRQFRSNFRITPAEYRKKYAIRKI